MATTTHSGQALRYEINPLPGETQRACTAIAQVGLPRSRGTAIVLALYAGVILAAYFLTPTSRPMTVMIGIVAVLGTAMALQWDTRWRLRRLQADDPHSLETHFVEVGPEGLRTWCAHVDARYTWSDFSKVVDTAEFFLFVRASGSGAAIPKRLLDPARESDLRSRIREWAPDKGAFLSTDGSSHRAKAI